ncbi:MAG: ubiquinol-cytochrome c reductase iron-sulfur subunit [Halopseudomonas sp.]
MNNQKIKQTPSRRQLLTAATSVISGIGIGAAAFPFLASWQPSAKAKSAGAPVTVELAQLAAGKMKVAEWRGRPIYIVYRTDAMLKSLQQQEPLLSDPDSVRPQQPAYISGPTRSIDDRYLIVTGVCTHLGCAPTYRPDVAPEDLGSDWKGGFYCPCHGSKFDLAGRVFKGVPAPTNLVVPPHYYEGETRIIVGDEQEIS